MQYMRNIDFCALLVECYCLSPVELVPDGIKLALFASSFCFYHFSSLRFMSYRSARVEEPEEPGDEGSSHSEGECSPSPEHKIARLDGEDTAKLQKKNPKVHMWTAFLEEQVLTESLSSGTSIRGRKNDRGVESYDVPEDKLLIEDGELQEDVTGKHKHEGHTSRSGNVRRWHQASDSRRPDSNKASTSSSGERRFKKGPSRSKERFSNGRRSRKRSYNSTKALVANDYSIESLMNAEFTEGCSLDDLADHIANSLGEREDSVIPRVVKEIGEEHALKLFYEVRDIEATGGMKVNDGSRRRTPGGVFMVLFKSDPDISQTVKQKLMETSKAACRSYKKALRKNKNELALAAEKEKQLPQASDLLLLDSMGSDEEAVKGEDVAMD